MKEREDSENPEWVDDMYYDQQSWREERRRELAPIRRLLIIGAVLVSMILVCIWLW